MATKMKGRTWLFGNILDVDYEICAVGNQRVFQDLEQLIEAIGDYIDRHNDNLKPFIWTAKANDILERVTRAQAARNKRLTV